MTTQQVANRLVELCRTGKVLEAGAELYADNIVSIEPEGAPVKVANGKKAVTEKGRQFASAIEKHHGASYSDPIVFGRFFSVGMMLDAEVKGQGRMKLEEVCLYEVKDGKVVFEQFFY